MHSNSDSIKFMSYNDANEVVDELFKSLSSRYQNNLETSMEESEFIFDSVQLMYYKCDRVNVRRACIGSPDQIKKKESNNKPET